MRTSTIAPLPSPLSGSTIISGKTRSPSSRSSTERQTRDTVGRYYQTQGNWQGSPRPSNRAPAWGQLSNYQKAWIDYYHLQAQGAVRTRPTPQQALEDHLNLAYQYQRWRDQMLTWWALSHSQEAQRVWRADAQRLAATMEDWNDRVRRRSTFNRSVEGSTTPNLDLFTEYFQQDQKPPAKRPKEEEVEIEIDSTIDCTSQATNSET